MHQRRRRCSNLPFPSTGGVKKFPNASLSRDQVTWATTGATVGGQATLPPPSEMRRGLAPQCNHAWTPILAAAIQKRDVRVGQGGTRPAYSDLFRTLSPPA